MTTPVLRRFSALVLAGGLLGLGACSSSDDGGGDGSGDALCGNAIVETGEACDDGNLEAGDGCEACLVVNGWTCEGSPSTCEQQTTAVCGNAVVEVGEDCDDGNDADGDGCDSSCNVEDGYTCSGEPSVCTTGGDPCADVDCSDLDDACTVGVCNPDSGACEAQPADDGTSCDDGDACTETDVCTAGVCGGTELDCSDLDDACSVGVCDAETGACTVAQADDGTTCDDDNACTSDDVCTAGACGGTAVDCSALDSQCGTGVCNPGNGECVAEPVVDGTVCDDGVNCTTVDVCNAGTCSGDAVVCDAPGACSSVSCDEASGSCVTAVDPDGTSCDDGDACTRTDVCTSGTCGGVARDCSTLDGPCVAGVCDPTTGGCATAPVPDGTTCDDGNLCTAAGTCSAGVCDAAPVDCSGLDGACSVGVCDARTGECVADVQPDGASCDDSDLCTEADICVSGECGGRAVACTGDACNTGICNPATGGCDLTPRANGSPCSDFDACTDGDVCFGGTCTPGEEVFCPMDDPCMVPECDSRTGECTGSPVSDGVSCDDDPDDCFVYTCQAGTCEGAPRTDGEVCDDDPTDCIALFCEGGVCDFGPVVDCTPCGPTGDQYCGGGVCGGVRATTVDGFETGSLPDGYTTSGDATWNVDLSTAASGTFSARSGAVGDLGSSTLDYEIYVDDESSVTFAYRVDGEPGDQLVFFVDGVQRTAFSGDTGWLTHTEPLTIGPHVLSWRWTRNASGGNGVDRAWIDDVTIDDVDPCFGDICSETVFSGTSCVLCEVFEAGTPCDDDPTDCDDLACNGAGACASNERADCDSCGADGMDFCARGVCGGEQEASRQRFNGAIGTLPTGWVSTSDPAWAITDADPWSGGGSMGAGSVAPGGSTTLTWSVTLVEDGTLSFYYRVPLSGQRVVIRDNPGGSVLRLYDVPTDWTADAVALSAGTYELTFTYDLTPTRGVEPAALPAIDDVIIAGVEVCSDAACAESVFSNFRCLSCPVGDGASCTDGDLVGVCFAGECTP